MLCQEHGTTGDAVCVIKSVDGTQTFTDECRRDASVIWVIAAARCSRWLEIQKLAGDLVVFDRLAAFKIGGAEVSLKYWALSGPP